MIMTTYPIIPKPMELHPQDGYFSLEADTLIVADRHNQENAAFLQDFLAPPMGNILTILSENDQKERVITLKLDPTFANLGEEGYRLTVNGHVIQIAGLTPKGVFYGIQTLRQLLPVEIENRSPQPDMVWQIPCCEITDYPRFAWRGYMLDEGRHFQGKETVLRTLDLMALQKLNVFHWHLTEDQGWRIEIQRYPRLTAIGSRRPGTAQSFNQMRKGIHNGIPHSGFYTQDEIREIVAYAAQRHITIIPEIEIPGHCRAAVAAYPELSCNGDALEVATGPGIYKDIYCAGKETTFEFIQNVLDEILMLFPAPIIHIGGDEAPKARWKKCPACQRRIQDESLQDEHELQTYFTKRIADYLTSHGRRLMGWNEILGDSMPDDAIVQYWVRNKKGVLKALKNGQPVVNSAYLDTYLDHSYSLTSLSRAYRFDPVFDKLGADSARNILGFEAPMWTEWVPNQARLDFQTYPRLTALAETGWTPNHLKDYADFRHRLEAFNQRLDLIGVQYAPAGDWEPPWYKRLWGIFTIAQPQTRIRLPE